MLLGFVNWGLRVFYFLSQQTEGKTKTETNSNWIELNSLPFVYSALSIATKFDGFLYVSSTNHDTVCSLMHE